MRAPIAPVLGAMIAFDRLVRTEPVEVPVLVPLCPRDGKPGTSSPLRAI